jgi:hypothetical protein
MQVRRGNIAIIFLALAVPILFWVLPYQVKTMPMWICYLVDIICGLVIIGGILALTPLWDKLFKKKPIQTLPSDSVSVPSTDTYSSIVKITAQEPSKRPPMIIDIALIIYSLIMLASGTWVMYLAVVGNLLPEELDLSWLMFILFVIAFPIWIFVDTLFIERRQRKLGRSRVAKEKTIYLYDKVDGVFDRCLQAVGTRQSSIFIMERPKLIKARWGNSILTVTVTNMGRGKVKVHIFSDSRWTTTKWDSGINQKNIDAFERLICSELNHDDTENRIKNSL